MFPAKNLEHLASFFLSSSIRARGNQVEGRRIRAMASASPKTLLDFLQPAKRLKIAATPRESAPNSSPSVISAATPDGVASPYDLSPEQKTRIEINKLLARYKRNISICYDRIKKNSAEGAIDVRLDDLLAEESWIDALVVEFQKPYVKNLCKFLESELRGTSPIYPPQHLIFNALNSTSFDRIKVVIIGQDPYHGPGQAMGLSFSVPEGVKIPSSLANIFKELKEDLGCSIPSHGNLERWAVQGVLLLNTVLTVRKNQANSHARKGWEQLTDAIIATISMKKSGVVFLLWGNSAQEKTRLIDEARHYVLKAAHPSGLSANRGFFGCRHFSKTNDILIRLQVSPIDWQL